MDSKRLSALVVGLLFLSGSLPAQRQDAFDDYAWASALAREFDFDDMAETIFRRLAESPGGSQTEKQQGKLGLAHLKASQGRRSKDLEEKLALLAEARDIIKAVLKEWPEKNTIAYFDAVFSFADLLQERGELAMTAVNEGKVEEARAKELTKEADNDFGLAATELTVVKNAMGDAEPDQDVVKWRVKNGAWYRLCLLEYNKAMTGEAGKPKRGVGLAVAAEMLEDYILYNETDDPEALLGALYGYLVLGQVKAQQGMHEESIANIAAVLDQILWRDPDKPGDTSFRLQPVIQNLAERTYWLLLKHLNEQKRYEDTQRYGTEMEERFSRLNLTYKQLGRAARVELADARLKRGDMNGALQIAAQVVEEAGGDASGTLANQLVAEVMAQVRDKTQFSPEIIRSAAKGAYSAGGENRREAIRYYRILLQVLDKVDPDTRDLYQADAYLDMGRAFYFMDRKLEALFAFREGARNALGVTEGEILPDLVRFWGSTANELKRESSSPEFVRLLKEYQDWFVANPDVGKVLAKSPGDILYSQGRAAEVEAKDLGDNKNVTGAIDKYEEAASAYERAVESGGQRKEQAMIKAARVGLLVAELQDGNKQRKEALPRAEKARKAFKDYIDYARDPANVLTDPKLQDGRAAALADARYSISRVNRLLMGDKPEPAREKELWADSLKFLAGFENDYPGQKSLVLGVLYDRVKGNLVLEDTAAAEADYLKMRALDPEGGRTAYAGYLVGDALRPAAEAAWDKVVGQSAPSSEADWAAVRGKDGFAQAKARLKTAYEYIRLWLLSGSGNPNPRYWAFVCSLWTKLDEYEIIADLHRKAIERFGEDADRVRVEGWRNTLLEANVRLAKAAEAKGEGDEASRLWSEAGRLADDLLKSDRYSRIPHTVRLAAEVYGGYITMRGGVPTYNPCLGQFEKARGLWNKIERSLAAQNQPGGEPWWEAKFYDYFLHYKQEKAAGRNIQAFRARLQSLRTTNPEFGGPAWKPYFDWLLRQA